jgi:hypothetical protein
MTDAAAVNRIRGRAGCTTTSVRYVRSGPLVQAAKWSPPSTLRNIPYPVLAITRAGLSGITVTACPSESIPSFRFSQVSPPSLLRISHPSSTAPNTSVGSAGEKAMSRTWLMCGGCGNVQSFVVGSVQSCSDGTQVSPPSVLLNTDEGSVPTYRSSV